MELHQVRYFLALRHTLNFTKAAAECNVTQPALTRAIQRLEEELGGPLLYREREQTRLTPLGRAMAPHFDSMLGAADAARRVADAERGDEQTSLRVGLGPAIAAAAVVGVMRRLVGVAPNLSVHFAEADSATLVKAMLADELDCALLPQEADLPERMHRWPLWEDGCVVVLPAGHRFVALAEISAADLAGEVVLVGERCGGFAARLIAAGGSGFTVRRFSGSWVQVLDLVAAELGLALLPDSLKLGTGLVSRRFVNPELRRAVLLSQVAGRRQGAVVANFVRLCRARAFA
jgi:LysR family transcriptional regulator, hydrogen peroxide-inducible genes activator